MLQQLENWLNSHPEDIDQWLKQGLVIGCDLFDMHTGIVSVIKDNEYIIRQVFSKLGDIFDPGQSFELTATYCEAVVKNQDTVTYKQVGTIQEMKLHPVYVAVQLESYIGSPLTNKDGAIVGTLNFTSHEVRDKDFSPDEIKLIERMAQKICTVLY